MDGRYLYAVASDKKTEQQAFSAPMGIDFVEFVPPDPSSALQDSASPKQEVSLLSKEVNSDLDCICNSGLYVFWGNVGV